MAESELRKREDGFHIRSEIGRLLERGEREKSWSGYFQGGG